MARTAATNIISTARRFNGTSDLVTFSNILVTSNSTPITCTQWINVYATPSGNFEVSFGYGNTRWFFIWQGATTNITWHFISGSSEKGPSAPSTALSQGTWYLIAGSYDPAGGASNAKFSIYNSSGTLVDSSSSTETGNIDTTGRDLLIGYDPNRNFYTHILSSEVRVYSRILSATELSNLAKQVEPSTSGLQLRAPLMESVDQLTAYDYSGNAHHGIYTGTLAVAGVIYRNPTRAPAGFG